MKLFSLQVPYGNGKKRLRKKEKLFLNKKQFFFVVAFCRLKGQL